MPITGTRPSMGLAQGTAAGAARHGRGRGTLHVEWASAQRPPPPPPPLPPPPPPSTRSGRRAGPSRHVKNTESCQVAADRLQHGSLASKGAGVMLRRCTRMAAGGKGGGATVKEHAHRTTSAKKCGRTRMPVPMARGAGRRQRHAAPLRRATTARFAPARGNRPWPEAVQACAVDAADLRTDRRSAHQGGGHRGGSRRAAPFLQIVRPSQARTHP